MKYASVVDRIGGRGYDSWRIHMLAREMIAQGEDVILMSIGDPDFETPTSITDVAIQSMRNGRTHYTPLFGEMTLRNAIAGHHQTQSGQPVTAENVVIVEGAQCGLFAATMCLLEKGDEVIIPEPTYTMYWSVIGATGAQEVSIPLAPERNFQINPADIAAAVTPRTRAILLNTPHNPTGAVIHQHNMEAIAEICLKHDLWILSDEVYAAFAYDQPHFGPASISELHDRCITISSLSKSHAMTGWRIGWVVGPKEFIGHVGNMMAAMLFGLPPFIQDAAIEALTGSQAAIEPMRAAYKGRRDMVCELLDDIPQIAVRRPEGGLYVMVDIRPTGLSSYEFGQQLLEQERVAVLLGDGFGPSAEGHLRLSLTAPDSQLEEACQRIARFAGRC